MHVISRSALKQFWQKHPDAKMALSRWFKIVSSTNFASFDELRKTFPSADQVGKFVVFNVGGNKFRVIVSVHFNRGKVYVRHVLTHKEYDQGDWKR